MCRGGRGFGGDRGYGGRGGGVRGGGRGGFQQRNMGPPDTVLDMGLFVHAVEDEMLCQSSMPDKAPYFNTPIGRVDEIFGPINEVLFSVKMDEGMVANSFKKGDKVYIGGDKLLPIDKFLPKPKVTGVKKLRGVGARGAARSRGRGARGGRGGPKGGFRGGRGAARGKGIGGGFGGSVRGAQRGRGIGGGRGARGRGL